MAYRNLTKGCSRSGQPLSPFSPLAKAGRAARLAGFWYQGRAISVILCTRPSGRNTSPATM